MSEIKLELRYPNSRREDITDAFVRGYEAGYRDGSIHYELEHCPACKNVADLQEALEESVKLRELVKRMWYVFIGIKRSTFADRLHIRHDIDELGVEVD